MTDLESLKALSEHAYRENQNEEIFNDYLMSLTDAFPSLYQELTNARACLKELGEMDVVDKNGDVFESDAIEGGSRFHYPTQRQVNFQWRSKRSEILTRHGFGPSKKG